MYLPSCEWHRQSATVVFKGWWYRWISQTSEFLKLVCRPDVHGGKEHVLYTAHFIANVMRIRPNILWLYLHTTTSDQEQMVVCYLLMIVWRTLISYSRMHSCSCILIMWLILTALWSDCTTYILISSMLKRSVVSSVPFPPQDQVEPIWKFCTHPFSNVTA